MPADLIKIEIDDRQINQVLARLVSRGKNLRPAMEEIAGVLEHAIEESFELERDPSTGKPWADLSVETTIPKRAVWPGKILQVSGELARSFEPDVGEDYVAVGTADKKAKTHQLGAKQGEFGTTSRGGPIPWGDIPARPFLGLTDDSRDEILDILGAYLVDGL